MVIDIVIILLLCIFSAIGFKKGMLVSLFSIFSFIASIYLTYLILPLFTETLISILDINTLANESIANDNQIINFFLNNQSKLILIIKYLLHIDGSVLNISSIQLIINIISFILLSIIIKYLLKITLKKIALGLKSFFIIGTLDRMCGLCFGFIKGVIIVCILCFVLTSLVEFKDFNNIIGTQVENSVLIETFNEGTDYIVKSVSYLFDIRII